MTERKVTTADGITIVGQDWGPEDGPPVLLLGGTGVPRMLWGAQIVALEDRYRVIAFDWRDAGASDKSPIEYDSAVLADDAVRVLDAFGVERAQAAGFSLGGCVGLQMGVRHADRLISLSTASCWARPDTQLAAQFQFWIDLAETAGWRMLFRLMSYTAFSTEMQEQMAPAMDLIGDAFQATFDMDSFRRQVTADATHALSDEELATINVPFLSLWGTEDLLVTKRHAEALAKAIPNSEIAPIEGVSHSVTVDHPDRYTALLRGWFDRHA